MTSLNAVALVGAGILPVFLFPLLGLQRLKKEENYGVEHSH